jgi:ectoine hydroxylase-related dioxygenase (phytanoyl-CoA dioxygenase family)
MQLASPSSTFDAEKAPALPPPARTLPPIDYAAHPAYAIFGPPTLGERLSALMRFGKGGAIALVRWLTDYEHLPKPPAGSHRGRWFARRAWSYAAWVTRAWRRRLFPTGEMPTSDNGVSVLAALAEDGVAAFRIDPRERARMAALAEPHFAALEARLRATARNALRFDNNRIWLERSAEQELYAAVETLLEAEGVLPAARAYLRRPVGLAHVIVQLNTPQTDFWTGQFTDCGVPDPECNYCHVDTAYGVLKGLVYLDDVTPTNGPFLYVTGSQQRRRSWIDGFVRRANDYAGLSSTAPEQRRAFMALPAPLRRKCAFGPDLVDAHLAVPTLLAVERTFTSDQGDLVIFDPEGIHRGGMVQAGARRALSIHLADEA